jgi:hypothetical protein
LDSLLNDIDLDSVGGIKHLIKFHMRSDVFSFPAIWADATRKLHKDWKRESKKRYDKDGDIDVHKLHKTDCVIMSLALLDWPYGIIKKEQSIIINSKHRVRGKSGEELADIISRSLPLVNRGNITFVKKPYSTVDELIKLYRSIFDQLENRSGVLVNVYPVGDDQGHAVVFAKDPYGNAVIFDAQSGVKFIEEEVEIQRSEGDMDIDETHELVQKPVGLYGRYGIGIQEKKEQGDREQIRYLAEHFSGAGWGDVVLFVCSDPELKKTYCWDYEQNPPIVIPYDLKTYKEIRPVGYPTLKDQLKYLGKVDVYKLKDDKNLPRKDNDPFFFGKIKKEKKKKDSKKDKPKKKKKKPSKKKSFISSLRNKFMSKKKKKGKKRKPSRTRRR